MENKKKNPALKIICILLVIVLIVCGITYYVNKNTFNAEKELERIEAIISKEDRDDIDLYDYYAGLGDDGFRGIIEFESDLINEPVLQSNNNDFYLRLNWITGEYSELGSIFMDCDSKLDSQNITIYGHYVYSTYDAGNDENGNPLVNEELMFTPLSKLIDEKNYEDNKYLELVLENEVREYEIVAVYYCPLEGEGEEVYPESDLNYYLTEFDDDYFEEYKTRVKEIEFYDTGVDFTNEDKYLTLQTCIENDEMHREIVLCKEVGTRTLDRDAYDEYKTELVAYNEKVAELEAE